MDVQSRPDEFEGREDAAPVADSAPPPSDAPSPVAAEEPVPPETPPAEAVPEPEPVQKYWGRGAYFSIARARNPELRRVWIDRILALGLDRVVLEDVGDYLRNPRRVIDFIGELKAADPDVLIAVSGDTVSFFRSVAAIPALFSLLDALHYDFEFWNPARYNYLTRADAFARSLSDLKAVRAIAEEARLDLEMPLAWFTAEEAQLLAPVLDRVLLGFYLADSSGIQTHIAERFMEAQEKSGLDVRVLLSANSRFSGPELEAGGLQAFEEGYLEYARGKPLISGIFWSSVESLADADVIK